MPLTPQTVRFGPFQLDLRASELHLNGKTIRLPEQPFQVLTALLEHPGEVVTREELRQRLWRSDTFVDFEHSLNAAVKRLREVLGDSAEKPRYIETLPRHGYRLIVAVEQPGAMPVSPNRRREVWLTVSVVVVVAVVAGLLGRQRLLERFRPVRIESLAVLPLENLSGNPDEEYFADGMTEQLITQLGKIRALRVISRHSVMQYKGTTKPVPQIARELHVDAIIEGSALRAGDRVRITAQLVQANPERHLWAESYERDLRDVIVLQREVGQAIVREIKIKVTPEDNLRLARTRTVNPEAYQAYLKGLYFLRQWPRGLDRGTKAFQEAIAKDPTYAPAYAGLALCYGNLGFFQPPNEVFPKAKAAALKALELDEAQPEAHAALGIAKLNYDWDWTGAEREFRRALELNPNSTDVLYSYELYLVVMGRFDAAIGEAKRNLVLDPLSLYTNLQLAWVYMMARRYDEAIEQFKRTLELDSNYNIARVQLAWCYTFQGRYEEALAEYKKPEYSSDGFVGFLYAVMGKRGEALKVIENMKSLSTHAYVDPYEMAIPYAGLGDKDQAMKWLTKAYEERSTEMPQLKVEPFFDALRSDPRFQDLLRRMNFPQ